MLYASKLHLLLCPPAAWQVPNINPDSTALGFYRTSASGVNFNRVWDQTSPTSAQELYFTQQAMKKMGVDLFLDVHTDE
jgi:murein tripeptide amidase MpaA